MVSKRGTTVSGTLNGVAADSGTSSPGFSRRAVFFPSFLLCIGLLFLFLYASSATAKERKPDIPRMLEKKQGRGGIKRKEAHASNGSQVPYTRKIDLVYRPLQDEQQKTSFNQKTPTPEGWEPYDGSIYTPERGYGWLTNLWGVGRDRGVQGIVILPDGTKTSPEKLKRPELANFEGWHGENRPLVFRIDLQDGWYRVSCASVDPDRTLRKPLVDLRAFKCRAHDVVFAGANYGWPMVVGGRQLVEGSGIVEVTDGHLRIVVGDPAYAGWTWHHPGPWYTGLKHWWNVEYNYSADWYQTLTRTVDPGFHALSLNSLEVERVPTPATRAALVFRDFFNRDDNAEVNAGIGPDRRWFHVKLHPSVRDTIRTELRHTSVAMSGVGPGANVRGLLQQQISPAEGTVRYSTRVSLFTGEGSQKRSGTQEAGIILLADPSAPNDFNSTFLGIQFNNSRSGTMGRVIYRVGNGRDGYRTNAEVPDTALPFKITEGEFEIIVDHDVATNALKRVRINGVDVTERWPLQDRMQRISRGLFGIRSLIHNTNPSVNLQQFYWYYQVEALGSVPIKDSFTRPSTQSARSERRQRQPAF
jgi:hypothetical protein